jgi:hypothetical protein
MLVLAVFLTSSDEALLKSGLKPLWSSSVLQDLSVEIKNLEAVTKWANQQLHAARLADGELVEVLLDGAPRLDGAS